MFYGGRTHGLQCSAAASTLPLTVRSAWSHAGKDLDRDNGDEGGPARRADGTGMLTAPYSTLQLPGLTMGINCLPIAQIEKLVQRGLAHAKMTQHVSAETKFANVKLILVLAAKLLPAQGQGLDPASWSLSFSKSLEEQGQVGRCPRCKDYSLYRGLLHEFGVCLSS